MLSSASRPYADEAGTIWNVTGSRKWMAEKKESSGKACTSKEMLKVSFQERLDIAGKENWKGEEYFWREIGMLVSSSLPTGVLEGCLSLTTSLGKGFKETLLHMSRDVFRTIEDRCLNHTSEIWRSRWLAESSNEGSEREAGWEWPAPPEVVRQRVDVSPGPM